MHIKRTLTGYQIGTVLTEHTAMKVEHSVEIDGIKATLVFQVQPENSALFCSDQPDHATGLDTEFSAYPEAFRNIRVSNQVQKMLLEAHKAFYQSLVDSAFASLPKKL